MPDPVNTPTPAADQTKSVSVDRQMAPDGAVCMIQGKPYVVVGGKISVPAGTSDEALAKELGAAFVPTPSKPSA